LRGGKVEDLYDWGNFWVVGPIILMGWVSIEYIKRVRQPTPLQRALILWIVTLLLHGFYNLSIYGLSLAILSLIPWGIFTGLGVWGTLPGEKRLDRFVFLLTAVIGFGYGAAVIYEFFTGDILLREVNKQANHTLYRYSGLTSSPVSTGISLTCGLFAAIWVWIEIKTLWARGLAAVTAAAVIGGSLLCLGRLSLICGVVGVAVQAKIMLKKSVTLVAAMTIASVVLLGLIGEFLVSNNSTSYFMAALDVGSSGNSERLHVYSDQIEILSSSIPLLLLGSGSGSTSAIPTRTLGDEETTESSALRLLREFGLIGSFSYAAVMGLTFISLWKAALTTEWEATGVIFLTFFVTVCLQVIFSEILDSWPASFYLWSAVAVGAQLDYAREAKARARVTEKFTIEQGFVKLEETPLNGATEEVRVPELKMD
jgi:hypothetical protein